MSKLSRKTTKGTDKAPPRAAKPAVQPKPRAAKEELSDTDLEVVAGGGDPVPGIDISLEEIPGGKRQPSGSTSAKRV